eukprot:gene4296-5017_t
MKQLQRDVATPPLQDDVPEQPRPVMPALPGYYFDTERNRYFKLDKDGKIPVDERQKETERLAKEQAAKLERSCKFINRVGNGDDIGVAQLLRERETGKSTLLSQVSLARIPMVWWDTITLV